MIDAPSRKSGPQAAIRKYLGDISILVGMTCVALGLALAIAARNGVEHEYNELVTSVGRDLLRVAASSSEISFEDSDIDQLRASPGIVAVAGATMACSISNLQIHVVGTTANYISVHSLPLSRGRAFEDGETGVAVLSDAFARSYYPDQDPIGQVLDVGFGEHKVIGILAPLGDEAMWAEAMNMDMLLPVPDRCRYNFRAQDIERCMASPFSQLWIRLDAGDPEAGMASVISVLGDRGDMTTISTLYDFTFLLRRRTVRLFSIIALALLFIGAVNAFAIGLTTVAQRTPGIGTRRALGAGRMRTALSSLLRVVGLTAVGVIAGSGLAIWMAGGFEQLLSISLRFGPLHFAGAGLLVGAAALAGTLPAVRASRIPPVRAIRLDPLQHEKRPLQGWGWLITAACVAGISSVVFVVALSDSIAASYQQMYGDLEPNVVAVVGGRSIPGKSETGYELQRSDIDAIFDVPGVTSVAAERSLASIHGYAEDGTILYDQATFEGSEVMGTLVEVVSLGEAFLAGSLVEGRIPTSQEFADGAPVIVLSKKVADETFGTRDPIGQEIAFGSVEFVVIGVLHAPKTNVGGASQWLMMVPAGAVENEISSGYRAWVRMDPGVNVETTVENIERVLGDSHPGSASAEIEGPAQEMGRMIALANSITLGSLRLGILALIVSAFGLGNLFWAQTMRRRRQIAIQRAVGATATRVSLAVFRQAVLTTAVAGVLSIGVAVLGVRLLADWFSFDVSFQWQWLVWTAGAVLISASLGGGLPALWAARLSPMEGIRKGRF